MTAVALAASQGGSYRDSKLTAEIPLRRLRLRASMPIARLARHGGAVGGTGSKGNRTWLNGSLAAHATA